MIMATRLTNEDYTKKYKGMKYGKLTIVDCIGRNSNDVALMRCKCECGNIKVTTLVSLIAGHTKSCGCKMSATFKSKYNADYYNTKYVGMHFGDLTVIGYVGKENNRHIMKCKCNCGNYKDVALGYLLQGKTKSCGCRVKKKIKTKLEEVKNNEKETLVIEVPKAEFADVVITDKIEKDCIVGINTELVKKSNIDHSHSISSWGPRIRVIRPLKIRSIN